MVTLFKGKGSESDPGNYRGIFLLEVAGKIFSRVLTERLASLAENFVQDTQCGFRANRSTLHMVFSLKRVQETARRGAQPAAAVFVDFKKAFDSPPRQAMWDALDIVGCPPRLKAVVCELHRDPQAVVRGSSNKFGVLRGVRQGSVEGPVLYGVLQACCVALVEAKGLPGIEFRQLPALEWDGDRQDPETRLKVDHMEFADDMVSTGESCEDLTRSLKALDDVCGPLGLEISTEKTEWMPLSRAEEFTGEVTLNGTNIKKVSHFCYLGVEFQSSGGDSREVAKRLSSAKANLRTLRFVLSNVLVKRRTKARLIRMIVLPALLYGAECWALTAADERKIEAFMNILRAKV